MGAAPGPWPRFRAAAGTAGPASISARQASASKCGSSGGTTLPVFSTMSAESPTFGHGRKAFHQAMASPTTIRKGFRLREAVVAISIPEKRREISWRNPNR